MELFRIKGVHVETGGGVCVCDFRRFWREKSRRRSWEEGAAETPGSPLWRFWIS